MARSTMRGFSKRIKDIAADVEKNSDSMVRKTVITIVSAVVLATPVDTGRARSNWRTALGRPFAGTLPAATPGQGGSTGAQNASAAIWQAEQEMRGYSSGDVWIANNLPYIEVLNTGSSDQAPAGFIQTAIADGVRAVNQTRLIR